MVHLVSSLVSLNSISTQLECVKVQKWTCCSSVMFSVLFGLESCYEMWNENSCWLWLGCWRGANYSRLVTCSTGISFSKKGHFGNYVQGMQVLYCYTCQEWMSEDDPLHEEPNLGCQAKERVVINEYIVEAKEYVDDAIIKNIFLSC